MVAAFEARSERPARHRCPVRSEPFSAFLARSAICNDRRSQSGPHYLYYESGAVVVANSEITEAYLSFADDPVVERKPIDISVTAITKRVERVRRWSIKEDLLSREYAPRSYRRD
jgi:hypothetical protein